MSSTVNINLALISSSYIIPQNQLREVFEDCIQEMGGIIQNNILFLDHENLGKITINSRIVLSFSNDLENAKRTKVRNLLRNTFTRKVSIAHENYLSNLMKEKEKLEQESLVEKELLRSLASVKEKITKSKLGFERQTMSECEAMKSEIVDAAIAQGYEVLEEKNNEGIQLQFIRRDYSC